MQADRHCYIPALIAAGCQAHVEVTLTDAFGDRGRSYTPRQLAEALVSAKGMHADVLNLLPNDSLKRLSTSTCALM
jgi:hypothetical protein